MKRFRNAISALALSAALVTALAAAPVNAASPAPSLSLTAHNLRHDRAENIDRTLSVSKLDVAVDVAGRLAQTTLTVTFANPTDANLEGDFSLDLPTGASVTGYALDINGVMTDGVLMPQFQAREAYEQKLRQGVDPGLAEVDAANRFRTHVFPIRPESGRTIRVTYVQPVGEDGTVAVPLTTAAAIANTTVTVTTHGEGNPVVTLDSAADARTTDMRDARTFTAAIDDHLFAKDLVVSGLSPSAPIAVTQASNGDAFFELIVGAAPQGAVKAKRLRVVWDASRSRRDQDTAAEIRLLADYIRTTAPASLDLVIVADETPRVTHFNAPDADAVAKVLSGVTYAGATRFDGLKALPGKADTCLVFSDGAVTIGDPDISRWHCRVSTVSSSKAARRDVLQQLAARNGGQYADLSALTPAAALGLLTQKAPGFSDITDGSGDSADFTVSPLNDGRYRIVGPVPRDGELDVSTGDHDQHYDLGKLPAASNDAAATLWGRALIDRQSVADAPDDAAVLNLARRYHVATPDLSFVVFEHGHDYADAGVEPPATASAEVRDEYKAARDDLATRKADAKKERLATVLDMWTEQKKWWASKPMTLAQAKAKLAKDKRKPEPDGDYPPPPPIPVEPAPMYSAASATPSPAVQPRVTPADGYALSSTSANADMSGENVVVTGVRRSIPNNTASSQIDVKSAEWNPDRPYFKALEAVKDRAGFDAAFAAIDAKYGDTPAFYFDVAEWMFRRHIPGAAAVARNALDVPGADIDTSIILASRLLRYDDGDDAIWLDEHILRLTPEKPQAMRNLALALIDVTDTRLAQGKIKKDAAITAYERALGLLSDVVLTPWHSDYDGIEVIALMEANHLAAKLKAMGDSSDDIADILPARLTALLDVDVRVTLEWNTDHTDMDLWVDEPSGERAIYSNPKTLQGGRLSNDMTQGYGPEEYLLRTAPAGDYKVLANIFAADVLSHNGETSVTVHLYRDWGRPTEKVETFVTALKKGQSEGAVPVGSFQRK